MLAFEPPDLGPLLGHEPAQGRRGHAGRRADGQLLRARGVCRPVRRAITCWAFSGVNGRGEAFKSGGRVMKNVTGYDLSKLLAGSWGTLAVLDEVSVKVLPAPDQTATLLLKGLKRRGSGEGDVRRDGQPARSLRRPPMPRHHGVARRGVAPSVQVRLKGLRELMVDSAAAMEELGTLESRTFWRNVRDAVPLEAAPDSIVWRISCPPSEGPALVSRIRTRQPALKVLYDWSAA